MQPVVSVIIPVYNVEIYLKECLNSVINQSYKNLEIILVDDGSKDKSGEICDEFAKNDSRVKVFHKENGGVSSARNLGLDMASGKYIAFVDSDDYIKKDFILSMINSILKNHSEACIVQNPKFSIEKENYDSKDLLEFMIYDLENRRFTWGILNKMYDKNCVNDIRFSMDEKVGEDFSFFADFCLKDKKISVVSNDFYYYRIDSETSVMHNEFNADKFNTVFLVCDRFIQKARNLNDKNLENSGFWYKTYWLIYLYYRTRNEIKDKQKKENLMKQYSEKMREVFPKIAFNGRIRLKIRIYIFLLGYCHGFIKFTRKIRNID
ncbi:glycosyltransferase family 2 protein [Campylobacter sp. JMF_01 NE2]|uniref:glycosyltransferase family 2 protein n=1 Tax=unclassified Campylobacter TaxID=2593542 RepID=UPI0022E9F713|nr:MULTISPECIES: glycosyltransferase family 2 protein [unclassified Campylobacter]MDA3053089.1 glycosyltransferase family 2 protein [Campylobacter sp. JMF_03 NE3]MDA3067420.1 glycosyltransferase family 2 protein [Campylobacter sp. JMF_01 NE2]